MQRPLRSLRRVPSTCTACGRLVDASEPTCSKCGQVRPDGGWLAISGIRPEESPGIELGAAPVVRTVDPDEDEDRSGPQVEEIPEAVFDLARPTGVAVGIRTTRTTLAPEPAVPVPAQPLRIRVGPKGEPRSEERTAETLETGDYTAGAHESDEGRLYSGRYWIEETLSSSPALARSRAVQEPAVRRVVLTVLRTERPPEIQQALESRFLRDARLLARVRHPSLAPVHDAGRSSDGTCFATEEVLYGSTFGQLVAGPGIPPEALLTVITEVADALGAMHEAGVVHRCLRSDAVVVPTTTGKGSREPAQLGRCGWHVLPEDFASEENVEVLLATAPEVLGGQEPDELSDVYAIGALLYHALAGRPTYPGGAAEIRQAALAGPPEALAPAPGLVGDLRKVAMRCVAARPEDRFPSARSLVAALRALSGAAVRPVLAVPAPAPAPRFPYGWAAMAVVGTAVPTFALVLVLAHPFSAPAPVDSKPAPVAAAAPAAPAAPATAAFVLAAPVQSPSAGQKPVPAVASPAGRPAAERPAPVARPAPPHPAHAEPAPAPVKPVAVATPVKQEPPAEPVVVAVVAPVAAPVPAPVAVAPAPSAPAVPGASGLTGLWLGKAPGATLAFDLAVSPDGRVTGRARRSDHSGEAGVVGRVSQGEGGLVVDLQITESGQTQTYSGVVVDGALSGHVYDDGKSVGRFIAKR